MKARALILTGSLTRQRGISMIETLAAMVIFSASAVVLFSWIGQTADRLAKLNVEQRRLFGELAALEYMRVVNPMGKQSGGALLEGSELSWEATPVGAEEAVRATVGGAGNYVVQLYKVQVTLRQASVSDSQQSIYLAGWRQTAEVRRELPFQN